MTASGIVAVVGATGQQGAATARALLAAGADVRALVRDPAKSAAQALATADPRTVAAAPLDSIAPYVYPNGLAVDDHNGWSDVERVHRLMVDNGDGGKKIWMTEIGAPTSAPSAAGVSRDEQARQITDILWKASESGFSGPAFIFSIRGVDTADQDNFGALLISDWRPKVAAGVLAR